MRRGISEAGLKRIARRQEAQVSGWGPDPDDDIDELMERMAATLKPVVEEYLAAYEYGEARDIGDVTTLYNARDVAKEALQRLSLTLMGL